MSICPVKEMGFAKHCSQVDGGTQKIETFCLHGTNSNQARHKTHNRDFPAVFGCPPETFYTVLSKLQPQKLMCNQGSLRLLKKRQGVIVIAPIVQARLAGSPFHP